MTDSWPVPEFPDRLALLDSLPRGRLVAEVGVQRGDFAAEVLRRCAPRLLLLVDAWRHIPEGAYRLDKSNVSQAEHDAFYREVCERFRVEMTAGRVLVLRGLSRDVLPMLPDGWLDWVYLDADHGYEAVLADLTVCARKVRPGGLICGHDFVEAPGQGFGVVEAVGDFCRTAGWELAARTRNDRLCDGFDSYVLRRSAGAVTPGRRRGPRGSRC
jgi:hypothetical protein